VRLGLFQPLQKESTVMGPIPKVLSVVLLIGCLDIVIAMAGEEIYCEGPYKGRTLAREELAAVLRNHQAWLESDRKLNDERKAHLCQADLQKADLRWANLQWADLRKAKLQEARLSRADLRWADLSGANLSGASLGDAKLQRADLSKADFQEAFLFEADLSGADLYLANLSGADLYLANLQGAVYEPNPEKLPILWTLTAPKSELETLHFRRSPAALVALREAFKKAGMRTQERQLTYAIEHTQRLQAWKSNSLWDKSESLFKLVAFELPSNYGMSYGRPLKILGGFIGLFALVYMVALYTAHGRSGIWMVWPPDRVDKKEGGEDPVRVTRTSLFSPLKMWPASRWPPLARGLSVLLIGLYFSLLSAFSIGWRELNVGTWIARVQSREYVLRPTGRVRTVAGIQSLLSVYLLALWVLTYFGRPFE
jgi:hypothetical protein